MNGCQPKCVCVYLWHLDTHLRRCMGPRAIVSTTRLAHKPHERGGELALVGEGCYVLRRDASRASGRARLRPLHKLAVRREEAIEGISYRPDELPSSRNGATSRSFDGGAREGNIARILERTLQVVNDRACASLPHQADICALRWDQHTFGVCSDGTVMVSTCFQPALGAAVLLVLECQSVLVPPRCPILDSLRKLSSCACRTECRLVCSHHRLWRWRLWQPGCGQHRLRLRL